MNRQRLQFATSVFLSEIRRQAVMLGNGASVKSLGDYPPDQRSALMQAVEKSIKAVDPAADAAFESWLERQKTPDTT